MSFQENLNKILTKHQELSNKLASGIKGEEFKKKTGCPILINTSFNIRGEPIVCTPAEAFKCFMGTEMDTLVIGNCFLKKDNFKIFICENIDIYDLIFLISKSSLAN